MAWRVDGQRGQAAFFGGICATHSRGPISVTERAPHIRRLRNLARSVAQNYYASRARPGSPMAPRDGVPQMPPTTAA
ncbi:glycine--tRNA ligase subunit alpha [Acinetobacter baumannii]|nr:glycine--tRNA ligase subunit alpha [Acinetobacter baumannii]